MGWKIEYADAARRQLRKLNPQQTKRILDYLDDRIGASEDPRQFGEPLTGDRSGYWRFRIGDFRAICDIIDDRVVVLVVKVGHRRDATSTELSLTRRRFTHTEPPTSLRFDLNRRTGPAKV